MFAFLFLFLFFISVSSFRLFFLGFVSGFCFCFSFQFFCFCFWFFKYDFWMECLLNWVLIERNPNPSLFSMLRQWNSQSYDRPLPSPEVCVSHYSILYTQCVFISSRYCCLYHITQYYICSACLSHPVVVCRCRQLTFTKQSIGPVLSTLAVSGYMCIYRVGLGLGWG